MRRRKSSGGAHDGTPAERPAEDLREYTRPMCDIIAMAFQTDKTRIASLLLARDLSGLYYPFLQVKSTTTALLMTTCPMAMSASRIFT